ncbi:hypothetical protein E6C27_scaffold1312G00060 [Cucumis melo var. makuwa]|uniref:Uncharacterized protein n=1 Tax=Cucumis melo var. makuwa TaxID=1194695 RepID=A0A5A7UP24_CUCMM|nr:hypothetical protein E6C27_scaffold1312G00060 [Cucumis melo var. makuwa]
MYYYYWLNRLLGKWVIFFTKKKKEKKREGANPNPNPAAAASPCKPSQPPPVRADRLHQVRRRRSRTMHKVSRHVEHVMHDDAPSAVTFVFSRSRCVESFVLQQQHHRRLRLWSSSSFVVGRHNPSRPVAAAQVVRAACASCVSSCTQASSQAARVLFCGVAPGVFPSRPAISFPSRADQPVPSSSRAASRTSLLGRRDFIVRICLSKSLDMIRVIRRDRSQPDCLSVSSGYTTDQFVLGVPLGSSKLVIIPPRSHVSRVRERVSSWVSLSGL